MTVDRDMTWELLNAYVDGELNRATSAQVAAAAAADPSLAARVATLSRLKASVPTPDMRGRIPPLPQISQKRWLAPSRLAAIAAALALIVAASVLIRPDVGPPARWLEGALTEQRQWMASVAAGEAGEGPVTIKAATAARPLDLSDAQLKLVYAVPVSRMSGQNATFLGYRGPHGCMVGLWIGPPQDGLGTRPAARDAGPVVVRAWRDNFHGYALIAKGMDPARIDGLAAAVARLVDPGQFFDDGIRIALRDVAQTGSPCRT